MGEDLLELSGSVVVKTEGPTEDVRMDSSSSVVVKTEDQTEDVPMDSSSSVVVMTVDEMEDVQVELNARLDGINWDELVLQFSDEPDLEGNQRADTDTIAGFVLDGTHYPPAGEETADHSIVNASDSQLALFPRHVTAPTQIPVFADTTRTARRFDNFINNLDDHVTIFGQNCVLDMLQAATNEGVRVQESRAHGSLQAYKAIHKGLLHVYSKRGMDLPTLPDVRAAHRDPEHRAMHNAVAAEWGAPIQASSKDLDMNGLIEILRVLSMQAYQRSNRYVPFQLGVLQVREGLIHASIFRKVVSKDAETMWIYLKPSDPPNTEAGTWHGICSDQDIQAFKSFTKKTNATPIPAVLRPYNTDGRVTKGRRSTKPAHPSTNKERASGQKRETAIQILQLRNEFPPHVSPEEILASPGDVLHYNNLLRAAIWYSNKEIFSALNDTRVRENKAPAQALSAITKRIKVAILYLADQQGVSPDALRIAFNARRGDNRISTRDAGISEDGGMQDQQTSQWKIDNTVEMIMSASKQSGLVRWRNVPDPIVRAPVVPKPQVAGSATTPGQSDFAVEAMDQDQSFGDLQISNYDSPSAEMSSSYQVDNTSLDTTAQGYSGAENAHLMAATPQSELMPLSTSGGHKDPTRITVDRTQVAAVISSADVKPNDLSIAHHHALHNVQGPSSLGLTIGGHHTPLSTPVAGRYAGSSTPTDQSFLDVPSHENQAPNTPCSPKHFQSASVLPGNTPNVPYHAEDYFIARRAHDHELMNETATTAAAHFATPQSIELEPRTPDTTSRDAVTTAAPSSDTPQSVYSDPFTAGSMSTPWDPAAGIFSPPWQTATPEMMEFDQYDDFSDMIGPNDEEIKEEETKDEEL